MVCRYSENALIRPIFAQYHTYMQQFIAAYLFQHKTCPLPGLGTLSVLNQGAGSDFSSKLIMAPKPFISFVDEETDAAGLLNYIMTTTQTPREEAAKYLTHFCNGLKKEISNAEGCTINEVGNLSVDGQGRISFKQRELPQVFVQPVMAVRVIHPEAEHQILVGDKETTNTVMTEMLAPKEKKKERWWIWAIVIGAISLLLIFLYFSGADAAAAFGNATKI